MPARFEYLVAIGYGRPEYVDDAQRFLCFLHDQRIDYLVLPKAGAPRERESVTAAVQAASASLEADAAVHRIEDRNYVLLDLSALHARAADRSASACAREGARG